LGGKGSFIVLLVIVAVLTLVLAMMAVYLFIVAGTPQNNAESAVHTDINTPQRPDADELGYKKLFEEKKFFNLKSEDNKNPVIQVEVNLVYFKKIKGIKNVEDKITSFESEIKEAIGTYFQQLTLEQVKDPACKKKAKEDLIKEINNLLSSDENKHFDIIYDIVFEEWFYQ